MNDEYDSDFATLLRQAAINAFKLANNADANAMLLDIYGFGPQFVASLAGRAAGFPPAQALALFTYGAAKNYEMHNGRLSVLFSGEKRTIKKRMLAIANHFEDEMMKLNPADGLRFGQHYVAAQEELTKNRTALEAIRKLHEA